LLDRQVIAVALVGSIGTYAELSVTRANIGLIIGAHQIDRLCRVKKLAMPDAL